jgi:hypothetical protein
MKVSGIMTRRRLSDLEQRNAVRLLVENTPGVNIVVDHLTWQDSTSST